MARKREQKEEVTIDKNAWMVTFSDLVTLLLTFFVMLISMSSLDQQRVESSFGFFLEKAGVLSGSMAEREWKEPFKKKVSPLEDLLRSEGVSERLLRALIRLEEENLAELELEPGSGIKLTAEPRGRVITLSAALLFKRDSAEIAEEAKPLLDELARALSQMEGESILVEGHTDNFPPVSRRYRSSWELSTARAVNVLRYLVNEGGLSPRRMAAIGYGGERPLVSDDSPTNRALNRRVEVVLYRED